MSDNDILPMTKEGYEEFSAELERLKKIERPQIISEIEVARSYGDLRENAEYHAAKEKQSFIEGRIADLEDKLARSRIVETRSGAESKVRFGTYVTVTDEENGETKTYRLVGDLEANITLHKISINSPLGRALLGKEADEMVEVKAPKGVRQYTITEIRS